MIGLPSAVDGACPATADTSAPVLAGATRARLTYLDSETRQLRCDAVLPIAEPAPVVAVPDASRAVDLVVEYLDDAGAVLGRGEARGIDLGGRGEIEVRIAPSASFACAPERGMTARGFHSATPLPNGEILLLGGIAGPDGIAPIDPAAGFFLQTRAEIYSTATGRSRLVSIANLVPRAFHGAYVVDADEATISIAVIGGLTVTGDPVTTPVAVVGGALRIDASGDATGASGQLIMYDLASGTFTSQPLSADVAGRGFGALPPPGAAAIAYVGGIDLGGTTTRADADRVDPATGVMLSTVGLRRPRLGATVTALSGDQLVVWGGDPTNGVGTETPELGELLDAWTATPASRAITYDAGSATGPYRAFHAAALAGDGSVIVAGGFLIENGMALATVSEVVQRLATPAGSAVLTTLLDGAAATPAGYTAAVRVGDGDVVASGGNPGSGAGACVTDHQGLLCAVTQGLRYDAETGTAAATGALGVARYGHAMSLAADGTVVVSGGLGITGGALIALSDVELYEPRGTADDPLGPTAGRDPGEAIQPCGLVP